MHIEFLLGKVKKQIAYKTHRDLDDNIKMDHKGLVWGVENSFFIWLRIGTSGGFRQHGNKLSGFAMSRELLDKLTKDYTLLGHSRGVSNAYSKDTHPQCIFDVQTRRVKVLLASTATLVPGTLLHYTPVTARQRAVPIPDVLRQQRTFTSRLVAFL